MLCEYKDFQTSKKLSKLATKKNKQKMFARKIEHRQLCNKISGFFIVRKNFLLMFFTRNKSKRAQHEVYDDFTFHEIYHDNWSTNNERDDVFVRNRTLSFRKHKEK